MDCPQNLWIRPVRFDHRHIEIKTNDLRTKSMYAIVYMHAIDDHNSMWLNKIIKRERERERERENNDIFIIILFLM